MQLTYMRLNEVAQWMVWRSDLYVDVKQQQKLEKRLHKSFKGAG